MAGWEWPSDKYTNISGYDYTGSHHAIDIGLPSGSNVLAPTEGTVEYVGWDEAANGGYGLYIIIKTIQEGYKVFFGHLSKTLVQAGQHVNAGTVIGESGSTGNSSGPHLHFEIRKDGGWINPWDIFGTDPKVGTIYNFGGAETTPPKPNGGSIAGSKLNASMTPASILDEFKGIAEAIKGGIQIKLPDVNWMNVVTALIGITLIIIGLAAILWKSKETVAQATGSVVGTAVKAAV